jgi:PhoH-like ATPase
VTATPGIQKTDLKKQSDPPSQEEQISPEVIKGNIVVIDSNIAVHQPNFIKEIRVDGNLLVIPWTVLFELNNLKTRPLIGIDAREAVRLIDKAVDDGDSDLIIETATDYVFKTGDNPSLDKKNPDHQIIATVNSVLKRSSQKGSVYLGYKKVKFLSNDSVVRIMSKTLFRSKEISIEPLLKDRVKRVKLPHTRNVTLKSSKDIQPCVEGSYLPYKVAYRLKENEPVIFNTTFDLTKKSDVGESKPRFLGIRKGNKVILVSPAIKLYGQGPMSNGKTNWSQVAAMNILVDSEIHAVFLQGGAGTGKTFLALAAALELRDNGKVKNIIVSRVTEPIDRNQQIGMLPGGVEAKMAPWVLPIVQNLSALCPKDIANPKKGYDENNISLIEKKGIFIQPLDYIRGTTFSDTVIIIEEAQNLTPHQIKTIITRAGRGTKIIFTGDLSQIEESCKLDVHSSGLTYAMDRLGGETLIGIVNFDDVVRSALAKLAEAKLK